MSNASKKKILLNGAQIYLENKIIPQGCIEINNSKIESISEKPIEQSKNLIYSTDSMIFSFPETYKILPGRIDLHIHGTHGVDVMDATSESLSVMTARLPEEGTTSFLATTVTMPVPKIEAALVNIANFIKQAKLKPCKAGAQILGVHLEGPFIAPLKAGSHKTNNIIAPDINLFKHWQLLSENRIKLVTIAPEVTGGLEFIAYLKTQFIVSSIGHTNANYQQATQAILGGCSHATHLYNAMIGLNHREPGAALAILEQPILAELIADGIHVSPEMLRFTFTLKGKEQLCLVTDSMRAKCMGDGEFELGQQKVIVSNKEARLVDGTLAGSILTMSDACQNMLAYKACDLFSLMYLTSINPAKQVGVFNKKGSIFQGKDADIIVLDENNNLCLTLCNGQVMYQKENLK